MFYMGYDMQAHAAKERKVSAPYTMNGKTTRRTFALRTLQEGNWEGKVMIDIMMQLA